MSAAVTPVQKGGSRTKPEITVASLDALEKHFFRKATLSLAFIFFLALVGQLVVHGQVKAIDQSSTVVQQAAQQQVLIERQAKLALAISSRCDQNGAGLPVTTPLYALKKNLGRAAQECRDAQANMLSRGSTVGHGTSVAQLSRIGPDVQRLAETSEAIVALLAHCTTTDQSACALSAGQCTSQKALAGALLNISAEIEPALKQAVLSIAEAFDQDHVQNLNTLLWITWVCLFCVAGGMMLQAHKIYKPLMSSLTQYASAALEAQVLNPTS